MLKRSHPQIELVKHNDSRSYYGRARSSRLIYTGIRIPSCINTHHHTPEQLNNTLLNSASYASLSKLRLAVWDTWARRAFLAAEPTGARRSGLSHYISICPQAKTTSTLQICDDPVDAPFHEAVDRYSGRFTVHGFTASPSLRASRTIPGVVNHEKPCKFDLQRETRRTPQRVRGCPRLWPERLARCARRGWRR